MTKIKTLDNFIGWVEDLELGDYIFRGVSSKCYEIQASTYIRLKDEKDKSLKRLLEVNEGLIEDARLLGHDERDGQEDFSDLEMLAELQHFRAATCLIDFTYNAQVALWFACQPSSRNLSGSEEGPDGKVVAVRNNPYEVKEITSGLLKEKIDYFFPEGADKTNRMYRWQPQHQNNRIIAQQSVFLFGRAEVEVEADCVIPVECKETLLVSLEKVAGITEAMLFPDFDGFARLHAYNRRYSVNTVQSYLQRASQAHGRDEWDDAISYYNEAISLEQKERSQEQQEGSQEEKRKRESLRSYLHLRRGWAHFEKNDNPRAAIEDYNKAIEDYNKAIELDENNVRAYRSRGHAKYKQGKYPEAIEDYNEAIDLVDKRIADGSFAQHILTYARRGTVQFKLGKFGEANQDFQRALELARQAEKDNLKIQIKQLLSDISSGSVEPDE